MEQEDQYQYDLALSRIRDEQDHIRQAIDATEEEVRHPSEMKYHFMMTLAIILDIIDWLEITGIGLIVTYALKIVFTPTLYLYGRHASNRIKVMSELSKSLEQRISHIRRRMYSYANRYRFAANIGRKIPGLAKHLNKLEGSAKRIGQTVARNPAFKNTAAIIADYIPLLDLLPWRTLGVYLAFKDEKKTYEETKPTVEEYYQAKEEEITLEKEMAREETTMEIPNGQR